MAGTTAGVVAQGGFYLPGRILVSVLAVVALGLALRHLPLSALTDLRWIVLAAAGISAWAVVRGGTAGGLDVAGGIALSLVVLGAGIVAARRARAEDLAAGLVGLGGLVGITAFLGVGLRVERWAVLVEATLWRGASTLTYPNAAAAVLATTALLALALSVRAPERPLWTAGLFVSLCGLGATFSRAGLLAFAVGVGLFAMLGPFRAVIRQLLPSGFGAALAVAALVPSVPVHAEAEPLLAVGGLVVGGLIAVLLPRLRQQHLLMAWSALGIAAAAAGFAILRHRPAALASLLDRGFTAASPGREGAFGSALDQVAAHPLAGSGPGQARYLWFDFEGKLVVSRWVHNEYLQWLVDLGAIGLVLLVLLIVAIARVLLSRRTAHSNSSLWAGAVAASAALAVHSAFDFLWELAVVPLLFGVLIGIAGRLPQEEVAVSIHGEETQ